MSIPKKSRFILLTHTADKAGVHHDLRFEQPTGKLWDSFAIRKNVPLEQGTRVLAVKTHDHNEEDALTTKPITHGYGKGHYVKEDDGTCIIEKYHPSHIVVTFQGKKLKGTYHFISLKVVKGKDGELREYLFFKGRNA